MHEITTSDFLKAKQEHLLLEVQVTHWTDTLNKKTNLQTKRSSFNILVHLQLADCVDHLTSVESFTNTFQHIWSADRMSSCSAFLTIINYKGLSFSETTGLKISTPGHLGHTRHLSSQRMYWVYLPLEFFFFSDNLFQ